MEFFLWKHLKDALKNCHHSWQKAGPGRRIAFAEQVYGVIGVDNVANKKGTHPRQDVSKIGTLLNDRVCFELEKRKIIKGK